MNLGQRRAIQREFGEVSKAYTRRVDPRGEREARQIVAWVRPRRHDWALDAACGSGRLARARAILGLIEYMHAKGKVWFAPMEEIAAHVRAMIAEGRWTPRIDRLPYYDGPIPELGEVAPALAH